VGSGPALPAGAEGGGRRREHRRRRQGETKETARGHFAKFQSNPGGTSFYPCYERYLNLLCVSSASTMSFLAYI
jgi:hypothetical protein